MAPFIVRILKVILRTKRRKVRRIVIHRNGNKHRHRGHLAEDLDNNLTDAEFTRMFRINRHSFDDFQDVDPQLKEHLVCW